MTKTRIWTIDSPVAAARKAWAIGLTAHLAIEPVAAGDDWFSARMPVTAQTLQPHGILHGGASLVLAESLASAAAYMCLDPLRQSCVGLEINANHLRSVRDGWLHGRATPLHLGRSTQVWDVRLTDDNGADICASRCTIMILTRD